MEHDGLNVDDAGSDSVQCFYDKTNSRITISVKIYYHILSRVDLRLLLMIDILLISIVSDLCMKSVLQ